MEVLLGHSVVEWSGLSEEQPAADDVVLRTDRGAVLQADLALRALGPRPATGPIASSLAQGQLAPSGALVVEDTLQVAGSLAASPPFAACTGGACRAPLLHARVGAHYILPLRPSPSPRSRAGPTCWLSVTARRWTARPPPTLLTSKAGTAVLRAVAAAAGVA